MSKEELISELKNLLEDADKESYRAKTDVWEKYYQGKEVAYGKAIELAKQLD